MQNQIDLVLAMPCYNEEDGIEVTIKKLIEFLNNRNQSCVIVIQDDCSTDNSYFLLRELAADCTFPLMVERNVRNLGHGPTSLHAYSRALTFCSRRVLFLDSDGQFEISDLGQILDAGETTNVECILGIRQQRVDPYFRRWASNFLRVMIGIRFGMSTVDPNTPIRLFSTSFLSEVLPRVPANSLIPNIWLTIRGKQLRSRYVEIPIRHRHRAGVATTGSTWRTKRYRRIRPFFRFLRFGTSAGRELLTG